ncbi:MAG TPA: glycosyltransferase family 4 protein [Candidatus Elarobacter sp.]|nr:glycosyltransferase family 4 protein [Candidatus Elarobacter sp.]
MRVVQLVPNLVGGGAEAVVRHLSTALAAAGVDVTIVSIYPSGLGEAELAQLGVPVIDLGRQGRGDRGYFRRLVRTLRELRPDVVHAHLHTGQYGGRAAALVARVPAIVFTVHGVEPGGPIRWIADRVLNAGTARFVVFTEAQRRNLAAKEQVAPSRIAVIPNGAVAAPPATPAQRDELRASLGFDTDTFALFFAGRLAPQKNQGIAIEALASLRASGHRRLRLVLAGDGPLADDLRAWAERLGVRDQVDFLGFRSDAIALAPAMDLFVMSSLWERMPLALGEAMMAGLAVVTTPWDGYEEFVRDGDTGYVATGFDAAALTGAILRAYDDDAQRAGVARRGQAAARAQFDIDAMARAHVAMYASLTRGPVG